MYEVNAPRTISHALPLISRLEGGAIRSSTRLYLTLLMRPSANVSNLVFSDNGPKIVKDALNYPGLLDLLNLPTTSTVSGLASSYMSRELARLTAV